MYLPNYESMSTSTRVILDKKVRVSSNYLYVKIGGSTSILAPILEYYSSIMLGTRTRLQIPLSRATPRGHFRPSCNYRLEVA